MLENAMVYATGGAAEQVARRLGELQSALLDMGADDLID